MSSSAKLFSSYRLGEVALSNRIVVAPMCQYSADDGSATAWHRVHLGGLAMSGAGLMFLEATGVTEDGRITDGCLGLWSDANEAALATVLRDVRALSPIKLGIQLGHAGRKASCALPWHGGKQLALEHGGWETIGPSAIGHYDEDRPPRAMTRQDMDEVRDAFVASAVRSVRLGFDAIELHGAHGYLLHQFLSAVANHRSDAWGGSLENRMRYPLEVFDAVRAAVPSHIPVGIRISASDGLEDKDERGWTLEQSIVFAQALKEHGCAWIDASGGGISPRQTFKLEPGYQVAYAAGIKKATGLPTMAVGLITTPEHAEAIVAEDQADLVMLARGMLYDPRWGWHAAAALGGSVIAPPQYRRALPHGVGPIFADPAKATGR